MDADVARGLLSAGTPVEEKLRRYIMRETKQRLHQPVFRAGVLRAYRYRCAVCSLNHAGLLDAAHIVPDRLEIGVAAVRNGMALCKIHHAAYDRNIMGIRPDLVIEIRQEILDESDGPMLKHGLQVWHGKRLMVVPNARGEMPNAKLLGIRYDEFKVAK